MKTRAEAEIEADDIVDSWAATAALTGWIPGSSIFLAGADMIMIRQVADAFGVGFFDMSAVKAHLGGIVVSGVGAGIASELLGAIPFIGWAARSAGMSMKAGFIGQAVIEYFRERSPLPA